MKPKIENLGDKANTNGFDRNPGHINKKGLEIGTLTTATLMQMVIDPSGGVNDARLKLWSALRGIAFNEEVKPEVRLKALKEFIDRFEGTITQKMEVNDTRPQIIVKDQEAADMINKMKDM